MTEDLECKSIIFVVGGTIGGTATLSYRIGKEYMVNGYDVFYLCDLISNNDNAELLIKSNIKLICEEKRKWKKILKKICDNHKSNIIMTYCYEYFNLINSVKSKYINTNCFLYVVNTKCLVKGLSGNILIKMIGKTINYLNRPYIRKMYLNNQLIFMDSVVFDVSNKFLKLDFKEGNHHIFLLPYNIPKKVQNRNKKNIILTMARISFPFKGYIKGLIDIFSELDESYDSELWIIGDGRSMNELKVKIASCSDGVKRRIKLFNNVSYSKIGEIIKKSKVFVGMGTGVLDAVANGVPSIAVKEHSYECLGKGVFCDHPSFVFYSLYDKEVHCLDDDIKKMLAMNENEYFNICSDCYDVLKKYYDVRTFFYRLEKLKNDNIKFSAFDKIGYMINILVLKIFCFFVGK